MYDNEGDPTNVFASMDDLVRRHFATMFAIPDISCSLAREGS